MANSPGSALDYRLEVLATKIAELSSKVTALEAHDATLQDRLASRDTELQRNLKIRNSETKNEIRLLEHNLQAAERKANSLSASHEGLKASLSSIEASLQNGVSARKLLEQRVHKMEESLADVKCQKLADNTKVYTELKNLEETSKSCLTRLAVLQNQARPTEDLTRRLEQSALKLQEKAHTEETRLQLALDRIGRVEHDHTRLRTEQIRLHGDHDTARETLHGHEHHVRTIKDQSDDLQERISGTERQMTQLQSDLAKTVRQVRGITRRISHDTVCCVLM